MRYMDDLLMIWKEDEDSGTTTAIDGIRYEPPLTLEDTNDPNFLETHIEIQHQRLTFRLKNVNEDGGQKIWRYARWLDGGPFSVKRGILLSSLRNTKGERLCERRDATMQECYC